MVLGANVHFVHVPPLETFPPCTLSQTHKLVLREEDVLMCCPLKRVRSSEALWEDVDKVGTLSQLAWCQAVENLGDDVDAESEARRVPLITGCPEYFL